MPDIIPSNPSPKARFLAIKTFVTNHHTLLDSAGFQTGVDFALLEYNRVLCEQNSDANGGAANHFKMRGALEFIHVLRNLALETPRTPTVVPQGNLRHELQ